MRGNIIKPVNGIIPLMRWSLAISDNLQGFDDTFVITVVLNVVLLRSVSLIDQIVLFYL